MTQQQEHIDGWYKITQGNNVLIRYFRDGCTGAGYHVDEYTRFGSVIEPVVVLTPAEYEQLQAKATTHDAMARRQQIELDAKEFAADVKAGRIKWR